MWPCAHEGLARLRRATCWTRGRCWCSSCAVAFWGVWMCTALCWCALMYCSEALFRDLIRADMLELAHAARAALDQWHRSVVVDVAMACRQVLRRLVRRCAPAGGGPSSNWPEAALQMVVPGTFRDRGRGVEPGRLVGAPSRWCSPGPPVGARRGIASLDWASRIPPLGRGPGSRHKVYLTPGIRPGAPAAAADTCSAGGREVGFAIADARRGVVGTNLLVTPLARQALGLESVLGAACGGRLARTSLPGRCIWLGGGGGQGGGGWTCGPSILFALGAGRWMARAYHIRTSSPTGAESLSSRTLFAGSGSPRRLRRKTLPGYPLARHSPRRPFVPLVLHPPERLSLPSMSLRPPWVPGTPPKRNSWSQGAAHTCARLTQEDLQHPSLHGPAACDQTHAAQARRAALPASAWPSWRG